MIWVIEHLDKFQFDLLESMEPFIDFTFDAERQQYLWKTSSHGFEKIFESTDGATDDTEPEIKYFALPIEQIDLYPDEESAIDNTPLMIDSFDYIYERIMNGEFSYNGFNPIRVVRNGSRFYTIDKQRLLAFRKALENGFTEFAKIPARITSKLNIEVRKIRMYRFKQITKGFVCNDWEEARMLSSFLGKGKGHKQALERKYKWLQDYLKVTGNPIKLQNIAIPLCLYLRYYSSDEKRLKLIPFESIMKLYL